MFLLFQLKAVKLIKQAQVIVYDDLGTQVCMRTCSVVGASILQL